jgi:hypothetical protein
MSVNNGVWCIKTCCQTLKHFDNDMSICCDNVVEMVNKSFYKYIYSLIIFWFITMKQWSATRNDSKPVLLIFPTALQIQQITQGVHMTIGRGSYTWRHSIRSFYKSFTEHVTFCIWFTVKGRVSSNLVLADSFEYWHAPEGSCLIYVICVCL